LDNPVGFREHRLEWRLGGEFGATLATARSEDRATGTGAHPKAETVHLGAAAVVGLECALAHSSFSTTFRLPVGGQSQPTGHNQVAPWKDGMAGWAKEVN
jgi:hypothetical protein